MTDSSTVGVPAPEVEKPDLRRSVTAGDASPEAYPGSGIFHINTLFDFIGSYYEGKLLPPLPAYWSRARDSVLAKTVEREGFWSDAVSLAITKMGSAAFEIESETKLHVKRAQELFHGANDGEGWGHFLSQGLEDFLCTDNGQFIEIRRATSSPSSRITGIFHLDSLRCWRTGNREIPVIYQDLYGEFHYLKWYEVFAISDRPNTRRNYFGVGRCAASRAYDRIWRTVATNVYLDEKLNPTSPHTLHFLGGINDQTLRNYLYAADQERRQKGLVVYAGAAFAPMLTKDQLSVISIALTELHQKFDPEVEFNHTAARYAASIGLDPNDLKPMSGQGLGVGAQSQVLADKARGKGLVFWRARFQHFIQNRVIPYGATFTFVEKDLKEEMEKAQIEGVKINNQAAAVGATLVSGPQGLQKLIDDNIYPSEYLPNGIDLTPDVALTDSESTSELDGLLLTNPGSGVAVPVAAAAAAATNPPALPTATDLSGQAAPNDGDGEGDAEETSGQMGEPGISNITVLDDDEPEDENDLPSEEEKETAPAPSVPGLAPKKGPGSRGGKYWIDADGKVRYGARPGYATDRSDMSNLGPKQVRALNRRSAKSDLLDSTTGKPAANLDLMKAKGWSAAVGPGGGSDFGKGSVGKNAAVDEAERLAAANPDKMYVVTKLDGKTYAIISKPINDLPPPPPPKKAGPSGPVAANLGGAARAKPKKQEKEKLSEAETAGLVRRQLRQAKKIFSALFGIDADADSAVDGE